ncbi:hypothetical protein NDU88_000376 [Pleurodeles waltl]|uniref:Uncharacterized protein n=1 Tax=Pleurodeles waltl TaxID=8319 RepID=A0AAV7S6L7_PLEWA|nr:hypothetical protein NDU88_000376 [Pleurodeles waltl]
MLMHLGHAMSWVRRMTMRKPCLVRSGGDSVDWPRRWTRQTLDVQGIVECRRQRMLQLVLNSLAASMHGMVHGPESPPPSNSRLERELVFHVLGRGRAQAKDSRKCSSTQQNLLTKSGGTYLKEE